MSWQRDRSEHRRRGDGRHRDGMGDFGGGGFEPPPSTRPRQEMSRPPVEQPNVTVTLKWFNATKGFGFVSPTDGAPDAFLHVSVLHRAGLQELGDQAELICEIGQGPKGPQVMRIIETLSTGMVAPQPRSMAPA